MPEGTGSVHHRVKTQRKVDAAIALRIAGTSYEQIAETLGYANGVRAMAAVEKALSQLPTTEDRERQRDLAGKRLERLLRGVWNKAINPDDPEHLASVRSARELIDRYAKLYGLDAPAEIVVTTPTTAEIENWIAVVTAGREMDLVEAQIIPGEIVRMEEADRGA